MPCVFAYIVGPYVVTIWSRNPRSFEATKHSNSTVRSTLAIEAHHLSLNSKHRFAAWASIRNLDVKRFRGGLVFRAHRLSYHSTLGSREMKKKKKKHQTLNLYSLTVVVEHFRIWCKKTLQIETSLAMNFTSQHVLYWQHRKIHILNFIAKEVLIEFSFHMNRRS